MSLGKKKELILNVLFQSTILTKSFNFTLPVLQWRRHNKAEVSLSSFEFRLIYLVNGVNFDNWKDINDNENNEDFDSEIFKYMAPSQS